MKTWIQRAFAPIKKVLPSPISDCIRNFVTAFLTPILFSRRTGHFKSSFLMKAVDRNGNPIPWYTYPCIDFLDKRDFKGRNVLEFGAGQSTLWWGKRAQMVVSFEGDKSWYDQLKRIVGKNIYLHKVSMRSPNDCVSNVLSVIENKGYTKFDIIIIDGLFRYEMIEIAKNNLKCGGIIICDDSEGYGFYDGFKESGYQRIDFYGNAPGVVLPRCTSIFFKDYSFIFDANVPIEIIAV